MEHGIASYGSKTALCDTMVAGYTFVKALTSGGAYGF